MSAHVAETMRQVKNSKLRKGGWVGGDAWFGSVCCTFSLMKEFGIHSTFIIKNNSTWFLQRILISILKSRHGERIAGKWAVMVTYINEIKIIAMAYAWSMKGISFFVSSCGNTSPSLNTHKSQLEDDFGGVGFKELARPKLAEFIYEYLPLIDEHNKQRQNILNLEGSWPTKNCWLRLVLTTLGMSITDMYGLYRYKDFEYYEDMGVVSFADKICGGLEERQRSILPLPIRNYQQESCQLVRITNHDGSKTKNVNRRSKRLKRGGDVGPAVQRTCWICRYHNRSDENRLKKYQYTTHMCKWCKTPL